MCVVYHIWEMYSSAQTLLKHFTFSLHQVKSFVLIMMLFDNVCALIECVLQSATVMQYERDKTQREVTKLCKAKRNIPGVKAPL